MVVCKRKCPKGLIHAKNSCKCVQGIGKLNKGNLSEYGYNQVKNMGVMARRRALMRAVRGISKMKKIPMNEAFLKVYRKLNAVMIYTRKSSPVSSKIFKADRDWLRTKF